MSGVLVGCLQAGVSGEKHADRGELIGESVRSSPIPASAAVAPPAGTVLRNSFNDTTSARSETTGEGGCAGLSCVVKNVESDGRSAVARGLQSHCRTPWGSCGARIRRREGKRPLQMPRARRAVARQDIGSSLRKGNDARFGAELGESSVGGGPACDRSSQWMEESVGDCRSGISVPDGRCGALCWAREKCLSREKRYDRKLAIVAS